MDVIGHQKYIEGFGGEGSALLDFTGLLPRPFPAPGHPHGHPVEPRAGVEPTESGRWQAVLPGPHGQATALTHCQAHGNKASGPFSSSALSGILLSRKKIGSQKSGQSVCCTEQSWFSIRVLPRWYHRGEFAFLISILICGSLCFPKRLQKYFWSHILFWNLAYFHSKGWNLSPALEPGLDFVNAKEGMLRECQGWFIKGRTNWHGSLSLSLSLLHPPWYVAAIL